MRRGAGKRRPAGSAHAASALPRQRSVLRAIPDRAWWLVGPLAVATQFFASRGALLGVPAADDYDYLYWLRFHPFTWFDSMGSLSYWRPVGRQLYYTAVDPILFRAPWLIGLLHGALLLLVFALLYHIARRACSAPVSASIAAFPILAEPLRALLVWPTGGEYLLALACTALAIHEAFFERPATCSLAMLAALLSHEASGLALVAIPWIAWHRRRSTAEAIRWGAWMAGVALVWLVGHQVAHAQGAGWLAAGSFASPLGRLAVAFATSVIAQLNLEDAGRPVLIAVSIAYAALGAMAAMVFLRDRSARERLRRQSPAILGSLLWFAVGVVPLALLLPDWNSWRTVLAGLWLGVAIAGTLAHARPMLAVALLAVRLVSLAVQPPAPSSLVNRPPETRSGISFQRVARFQRAVEGMRSELMRAHPELPPGTSIRYWSRPQGMAISFVGNKAIRVWYGDSTLTWDWAWSRGRILEGDNPVLGFDVDTKRSAVMLVPVAVDAARAGNRAMLERRWQDADSLLAAAVVTQSAAPCNLFAGWAVKSRIAIALRLSQNAKAESLNAICRTYLGETAASYGVDAVVALRRGDRVTAAERAQLSLARDPENEYGRYVESRLRAGGPAAP